jgi:hypothetical protein
MLKRFLLLLPLVCGACAGEQTRAAFSLREPARDMTVTRADHSAEHEANLQRALDEAIRAQEAADMREWSAEDKPKSPAALVGGVPPRPAGPIVATVVPCAVHNIDTDRCDSP